MLPMKTEKFVEMHGDSANVVPAFLSKLWTLVEDENTDEFICWSVTGKSFHVFDQGRFAKEVLPLYFKHSNIASFIRQLNMYGFKKVVNIENGGLKSERDDLEFAHPYFLQGHAYLLENIKRKVAAVKNEEVKVRHDGYSKVLTDIHSLRGKQDTMNSKLGTLKMENEALWREVANLRQKHMKQQQIVNKLIQFIMSLVGTNKRGIPTGMKRHFPLMINDASQLQSSPPKRAKIQQEDIQQGVQIHDITDQLQGSDDSARNTDSPQTGIVSDLSPQNIDVSTMPTITSPEPNVSDVSDPNLQPTSVFLSDDQPISFGSLDDMSNFTIPVISADALSQSDQSLPILVQEVTPGSASASAAASSADMATPSTSNAVALNTKKIVPCENDVNEHVDKVQSDLDTLRDLLATSTYSLDNATILSLFNPEGPIPATPENLFSDLSDVPLLEFEQPGTSQGNELMAYQPADAADLGDLFDLPDMNTNLPDALNLDSSDLNTPVLSPSSSTSKQITTEEID